jgi:hypothetical protein
MKSIREVSSACTSKWSIHSEASYAGQPLPQYGTGTHARACVGFHIMTQFRTRVFPIARRLARINAMPKRLHHHCHACGGDVRESIKIPRLNAPVGSAIVVILGH